MCKTQAPRLADLTSTRFGSWSTLLCRLYGDFLGIRNDIPIQCAFRRRSSDDDYGLVGFKLPVTVLGMLIGAVAKVICSHFAMLHGVTCPSGHL